MWCETLMPRIFFWHVAAMFLDLLTSHVTATPSCSCSSIAYSQSIALLLLGASDSNGLQPTWPAPFPCATHSHASIGGIGRRRCAGLGIAVAAIAVGSSPQEVLAAATATEEPKIKLAGASYTQAAMLLEIAQSTASMEGMLRQSSKDIADKMTQQERYEAGATSGGPGIISRGDMIKSIDVMIANSQLVSIPGGSKAVANLRGVQAIAKKGKGALAGKEYNLMAKQYAAALEDLRRAFEAMSPQAQAEGKAFIVGLRAKNQNNAESRLVNAWKKTLADIDGTRAKFSKQPEPVSWPFASTK